MSSPARPPGQAGYIPRADLPRPTTPPPRPPDRPARAALAAAMTEAEWQAFVIDLARAHGWRVAHFRTSLDRSGRWSTAVAADGAGFPDLLMVRERLIVAELKTERGRIRPEQAVWLAALADAGVRAYLWRPSDEAEVWRVLAGREPPGARRPS